MNIDIEENELGDPDFEPESDPDEDFIWRNKNQSCARTVKEEKTDIPQIKLRTALTLGV